MTGLTNVDDLLSILNMSEKILTYNSEIKSGIISNGGTIIYSYNNIIIATEITDELYTELQKNPHVSYIEDIPLKKYGNINDNLIDQFDISKLTGITETADENIYGNSSNPKILTIIDGITNITLSGVTPTITNTNLILSAFTNTQFNYLINVNGSLQMIYDHITPSNYYGSISINNQMIYGKATSAGIYNIVFKVSNEYGMDSKTLILTVLEEVKILNTNLIVNNKYGSLFTYTIESSGENLAYSVSNIPSGITLSNNILSGVFVTGGTFNMELGISGPTGYDSKILNVNVGIPPIITSIGEISCQQYSGLTYYITPVSNDTIYSIIGALPKGLKLIKSNSIYSITGIPIDAGIYNVKIKAINPNGEAKKDLTIIISQINIGWIINKY